MHIRLQEDSFSHSFDACQKKMQEILEKFEFFPIKCRVQRSKDIFKIAQENIAIYDKTFRLKVNLTVLHRIFHAYTIC